MRLLLVCTGNTCRSSMAEALAGKILEELGGKDRVEIVSAGTAAIPGAPASDLAVETLRERGLDLSGHSARLLEPALLAGADLVLVMTEGHKRQVLSLAPGLEGKVYTLLERAGGAGDIPDPLGGSLEDYRRCATTLEEALRKILAGLLEGNKEG